MSPQDFVKFALQIAVMLACALFFGQLMRRFKQPAVLGELIGGVILGPTVIGLLLPAIYFWLFQSSGNVAVLRDASIKLGMLFFLFTAGLEINLANFQKIGRKALIIGFVGTVIPIGSGLGLVYVIPRDFWGPVVSQHLFLFGLFVGMNLANSANPVIARILMDIGLLKEEIGTIIMTATVVDDLINWTLFAIILSTFNPVNTAIRPSIGATILMVTGFFAFMLLIGRRVAPAGLKWVRSKVAWPSGFIAFTALVILLAGSAAESLGIHAFLGAFLVGVAVSGQNPEAKEAHQVIAQFVMSFFAPIYFVSIGMAANFAVHFDLLLVTLITTFACVVKIGSVLLGARIAGMPINRQVWAIASGLNARGATGIILAGVGLANGLIDERIFVAIFIMALSTSIISGPLMNMFLKGQFTLKIPQYTPALPKDGE